MKILFTIPLLALSIQSLSQIPTNGLVGCWPFNGNANDESGNGNNGIVQGAQLTIDRCGNENSAYYFNGISNSISIQNSTTLCPQDFTLSAWFMFTTDNQNSRFILSKSSDDERGNSYCLYYEENQLQVKCDYSSSLRYYTNFNKGIWNHAAFTLDAISSISKLYLNGKLVSNGIVSGNTAYSADPLLFGAESDIKILYKFFEGSIDDIMIYNRALSSEEILSLFYTSCNLGLINGESEVCQGQKNVRFYVQAVDSATNYIWRYSGTGANIIDSSNVALIDFATDATNGNLSVSIEGNNINTQTRSVQIVVNLLPLVPGVISGNNEVCSGQNSLAYIVPTIDNATSYIWSYSGTGATITVNSNFIIVDFADNATSGNLTVAGYNNCGIGPESEDFSIEVNSCDITPVSGNINIPNSFSPNGDGINDLFIIRGLTENSSVMIYDRSGKKIYESDNYQNDWDGKDNNGNALESDTYWYVIQLSGIPSVFKGFVYLKR